MPNRRAKDLLESIQILGQLEGLDKGGYARTYQAGGRAYRTGLHAAVAELLDSLGLRYVLDSPISEGLKLTADFLVDGRTAIFVGRRLSRAEGRSARGSGKRCVLIEMSAARSDSLDSGLRVADLAREGDGADAPIAGRRQTIFLDDPSFNFDYAHILPKTEKCSVMHGHTSSALIEIVGSPVDGMVVDFNDAKPIVKKAISDLDHKLFISERYVTGRTATHVDLSFSTVHGEFSLHVPKETTVLLEGEATVENLAQELLRRIAPKMPQNVEAVGVYVYEGLNKGTHLLARLHARGAETRRKR
ncbi:MAG TPA: 6-carboxytetrahydropterin synthase [Nitrososphaerales archaeon]|nr:6-carboxytetrahydropterin synthase [Nitrososphaerales archaeon]